MIRYSKMVVCFLLLFGFSPVQSQVDCPIALQRAREAYKAGRLEEVVNRLEYCAADESTSRPLRREMLSLLQEVYLYLDEEEKAEAAHLRLLRLDPFFRHKVEVPEVRYLMDRFETYPFFTYSLAVGGYLFSRPLIDQRFRAFPDLQLNSVSYKRQKDDLYGWTVNLDVSINPLPSNLEIATGIGISNIYLRHTLDLANARPSVGDPAPAQFSFLERQRWTQIPFLLKFNAVAPSRIVRSKFIPYLYAGGASEFLIKQTAQAIGPEIDFAGEENDRSASEISIADQRNRFNFAFMAGAGGKVRFKRSFILLEVRYQRLLNKMVSDSNRFNNEELLQTYNYVDNDYRIHSLGVQVGYGIFFFRSRKRK